MVGWKTIITIYLLTAGILFTGTILGTAIWYLLIPMTNNPVLTFLESATTHKLASEETEELRAISHNLTKNCANEIQEMNSTNLLEDCYVTKIYSELKEFSYVYDNPNHPLLWTWKTRTGDCSSITQLFCALLWQVSVKCETQCTLHHCWASLYNNKYVADLTIPTLMKTEDYQKRYGNALKETNS